MRIRYKKTPQIHFNVSDLLACRLWAQNIRQAGEPIPREGRLWTPEKGQEARYRGCFFMEHGPDLYEHKIRKQGADDVSEGMIWKEALDSASEADKPKNLHSRNHPFHPRRGTGCPDKSWARCLLKRTLKGKGHQYGSSRQPLAKSEEVLHFHK